MRKRALLSLMLAVALILTSACSLIIKDPEVDKETVIIEVGGQNITKQEVQAQIEAVHSQQAQIYSQYGISYDPTSEYSIESAREQAIEALIEHTVEEQKIAAYGFDVYTDEELAQAQEDAQADWDTNFEWVKLMSFSSTELTGDELTEAVEAKMTEEGYPTLEQLVESAKHNLSHEKLTAEVVKDVTVTDEEVQAAYDQNVADSQAYYQSVPGAYATDVSNGVTVYYVPAGYRYVKHILRTFTDEDAAAITEAQTQLSQKQSELSTAQTSLDALGEDASADDEATAASRAELTASVETLTAEVDECQAQVDAAIAAACETLQPTVDEILARIEAGEDFDALVEEYGEDPGMQQSPTKEQGYLVSAQSTNLVASFVEGAMALENIGDVSPAVISDYGIHIIRYESDAAEGAVPLEDVRQELYDDLLAQKQDEAYTAALAQWVEEANVKTYEDRLN